MINKNVHNFHIPVMGLAFTIDTPIRVAKYGISSVIALADDELIEKMRAFYSRKLNLHYLEITKNEIDYRAKRITAYLNLVHTAVQDSFEKLKIEWSRNRGLLVHFLGMLPNDSKLKKTIQLLLQDPKTSSDSLFEFLDQNLSHGAIDVNIMTKLDKDNFRNNEQLPVEFNDAHAALRGFAMSSLSSSVVLSAGMNPRLFGYFENFSDFFPNSQNHLQKKIILKVSDFRSAMIQGNFLAKKGLWVSEYRIESGLNCGGHAFATDGLLLGPILQEFKEKKAQLIQSTHEILVKALEQKGKTVPIQPLDLRITVQGGIGTSHEHDFMMHYFDVDAVGWGTPFLLVPEATSVDDETRNLLKNACEDDLYLSHISPLGVPFNTIKGTSNEILKQQRIDSDKAGSSCPKRFLALSKEFGPEGICTSSKKFQDVKLQELNVLKERVSYEQFDKMKFEITQKSCLCVGLANAAYLENDIKMKGQSQGVIVCPGPNLAYFDKVVSLQEMAQHIYGNTNIMNHPNRPHVFIKELKMYMDYLKTETAILIQVPTIPQIKKLTNFKNNLLEGIVFYKRLCHSTSCFAGEAKETERVLEVLSNELLAIVLPDLVMV